MTQSATTPLAFAPPPLTVDVLGRRLTSDGGWAWVAEADAALGLTTALAAAVPDHRRRDRHPLLARLRQRIYQIVAGYEDQADADVLRNDLLLKLVCGRLPEIDPGLASQPTFSRLENGWSARACYRLAEALGEDYLREREREGVPGRIMLDLDSTDDPTHGDQERITYTIGLVPNPRLERLAAPVLVQPAATDGAPVRLLAEALAKGNNTRFVVTTRSQAPSDVYAWYIARGEPEIWIKDRKAACFADRLSCHRFLANQVRLLLHGAAYCSWTRCAVGWCEPAPRMTLATVRGRLLKFGGQVGQLATCVHLRLASSHPGERSGTASRHGRAVHE